MCDYTRYETYFGKEFGGKVIMKQGITKTVAVTLCALLLAGGGTAAAVFAANSGKAPEEDAVSATAPAAEETDKTVKDETVYVLAGADGSVQKIIVSDWLRNTLGKDEIYDSSDLDNVENVKGSETYSMNGDNMRVWNAQGNDIYCQGNIDKELPVNLSVSYKLDGSSISADDLAGKSGRVTIRFDYKNNQYENVEIDGKTEKIYVPFAMLTGILLDGDKFTDVEVSNGKLINDGNRIAVVGLAFPGLRENLAIDPDKFEIPDYVEISADVKDFEMTNTVTVATNGIFSKLDSDKLDSADALTDSLNELTDAMTKLTDGSSELYGGLCTLLDKSGELISGIDKLAAGAEKIKNGAAELSGGAADLSEGAAKLNGGASALAEGAAELASGLGELDSNSAKLNAGAKQVFESLLGIADSQLAAAGLTVPKLTVDNYTEVLNGVVASLDTDKIAEQARAVAKEKVTEAVNAKRGDIEAAVGEKVKEEVTAGVTAEVRANVESQVLAAMNMTKEQYDAAVAAGMISAEQQAQINAAIEENMKSDAVSQTISANVEAKMKAEDITALISSKTDEQVALLIEQNMNSSEVQDQITAALEKAKSGAASISALKGQLDSYREFYNGLGAYTDGVASAKDGADALSGGAASLSSGSSALSSGASALSSGADALYAGIGELYDGILTLKDGAPALVDGVSKLRDGALALSDGLNEFNEKGVKKLTDAVEGDLAGLLTRVKATVDVLKDYKTFTALPDGSDGQVKFIYRTESIDAE